MARRSISLQTIDQTFEVARAFAHTLPADAVVCFFGGLGAGKTTFIKAVISELGNIPLNEITSPTFNYCQSYEQIHHFDLYRLESADAFMALGFDEYFHKGICLIEWSERILSIIPDGSVLVKIEVTGIHSRQISYETHPLSERHLSHLSS